MEKLFNVFSVLVSFICGIFSKLIGGWDALLCTLIVLMLFDYITGVLKAYFEKNLDSKIGFWGIIRKFVILIIVSMSYFLSNIVSSTIPLREVVIIFFISNEGISILENAAIFIPLPEQLKKALQHLRNSDNENESKTDKS